MTDVIEWTGAERALAHERIDRLKDLIARFCREPEILRTTPTPILGCTLGALMYLQDQIETELLTRPDPLHAADAEPMRKERLQGAAEGKS